MFIKQLLIGLLTYTPVYRNYFWKSTGGSVNARYCYSVWMRHIILGHRNHLFRSYPKVVAELGPGDSLGIGITALISGVEKYSAFDVVNYTSVMKNLEIFEELVQLFKNKSRIPDNKEFPRIKPFLEDYEFPEDIFSDEMIKVATAKARLDAIRRNIEQVDKAEFITFQVPWYNCQVNTESQVDMIYTQAVLEHVEDLETTYSAMKLWLKKGGFISHQIDFKSHGLAKEWNGHWRYPNFVWKIILGRRLYLINRKPCSVHLKLLEKNNFELKVEQKVKLRSKYKKTELAKEFRDISDEDLETAGQFFQAVKN